MSYSTSLAALCARTLDDLKGEQISVLDLRGVDSSPADYFVVCSANSDTHARALTDALTRATVNVGERRPRSEGRNTGEWVLLDYFDVVIHVFRTDAREYYKLEKLWGDAPTLDVKRIETAAVTEEKAEAEADVEEIQTEKVPKKRASKSSSTMKTSRKATLDSDTLDSDTLDSDTLDSDKDTPLPAKKRVLKAQTTAKATAKATAKTKTKTKTAVKKAISASTDDAPKPARGTKTATKKTVETITETTVKTAPKPATKKATAIRAQKTAMKTRATKASEK
jgi:ribosome-associated protein